MYNITLISTNHSESGKCDSEELYKIIEAINPDVIFEEQSKSLFDIVYNGNLKTLPADAPLELKCVKKYIQNYSVRNVPVDSEISPNQTEAEIFMLETIESDDDFKKFKNDHNLLKFQYGFNFFNSDRYLDFFERKNLIEKKILEASPYKNILLDTYKRFHVELENRENAMLQNIYNYSKENRFNQAVFLLGSGHRKSMIRKISNYENESEIKLNWKVFYGTH